MNAQAVPEHALPHRGAMRLIDRLLEADDTHIRCAARIRADNPLLVAGRLPAHAGIELLAQACGLLLGARGGHDDPPPAGAIAQVKSFRVRGPDLAVGAGLEIRARFEGGSDQAALFTGEVRHHDRTVLEASLMIARLGDSA